MTAYANFVQFEPLIMAVCSTHNCKTQLTAQDHFFINFV